MKQRWVGQRREFLILVPVALLILVALSIFALFAYRNTVALLIEERRVEAALLARKLTRDLARGPLPGADELRHRLPQARTVAVLDDRGRQVVATGIRAIAEPPAARWTGRGQGEDLISGSATFQKDRKTYTVQVDLPAPILRSRERGLAILTPVLLTMNGAITLLVLLFLHYFLAPFEGLLERARRAGQEVPESQDEVVFLVETFEKALEALAEAPPAEVDELKALEATLARSLESGVLLCDGEGTVLALNDVGAGLLDLGSAPIGATLSEALGRHRRLAEILDRAVRRGREVKRQECTVETADGERALGLTVHPLRRDDGAVRGFLMLFADLTDVRREQTESRLADSLSQLGELTAGVAHELRNSLATVRGYLTLVERDPDRESLADYLAEIRRESDHLQRVLEDFLTFARPGSTRPQQVDPEALLRRAAADPALGEAAVVVEASGPEAESRDAGTPADAAITPVEGDPQLLERALRNLLANAVAAQRDAGVAAPVRARLGSRDHGVEIRIDDRGPGLSTEAREKLFAPFFSQRPGGVGMGLALTRRIVLLHGGQVALENRPGGGTRATLWLPFWHN